MARFNHIGLQQAIDALKIEQERIDRNGPVALKAAANVLVKAMRKTVPRDTGALARHIKSTDVRRGIAGELSVEVYPQGERKQNGRKQRYAEIGFILEYGRSNMLPRPWMETAYGAAKDEVLETLKTELMKD